MKIDATHLLSKLLGIYNQRNKVQRAAEPEATRGKTDAVELSRAAQEILQLREQLGRTPDVREARVEQIKQALARGTYEVDARKVADKLEESKVLED